MCRGRVCRDGHRMRTIITRRSRGVLSIADPLATPPAGATPECRSWSSAARDRSVDLTVHICLELWYPYAETQLIIAFRTVKYSHMPIVSTRPSSGVGLRQHPGGRSNLGLEVESSDTCGSGAAPPGAQLVRQHRFLARAGRLPA